MRLEEAIKSFAHGMAKASARISEMNPDIVIAPMMGAVPFVDAMHAADSNFDPNRVYYMPASSHVPYIKDVMAGWMDNFLNVNAKPETPVTMVHVDEVVSGSSSIRVNAAIQDAIKKRTRNLISESIRPFWTQDHAEFEDAADDFNRLTGHQHYDFMTHLVSNQHAGTYSNDKDALARDANRLKQMIENHFTNHITHIGIGIQDAKNGAYEKKPRNDQYRRLVAEGAVEAIDVATILTMDKPDFCPVRYKPIKNADRDAYVRFTPVVDKTPRVTKKYLELLKRIGEITNSGSNPVPVSIERAAFSIDYLSPKYGGIFNAEMAALK